MTRGPVLEPGPAHSSPSFPDTTGLFGHGGRVRRALSSTDCQPVDGKTVRTWTQNVIS